MTRDISGNGEGTEAGTAKLQARAGRLIGAGAFLSPEDMDRKIRAAVLLSMRRRQEAGQSRQMKDMHFRQLVRWAQPRMARCFLILRLTGLRLSELARLRWRDVIKRGRWTFLRVTQTKTQRARLIKCSKDLVEALGKPGRPRELVAGECAKPFRLIAELRRAFREAGLSDNRYRLHSLRYAFAAETLRKLGPKAAAQALGYGDSEVARDFMARIALAERRKT